MFSDCQQHLRSHIPRTMSIIATAASRIFTDRKHRHKNAPPKATQTNGLTKSDGLFRRNLLIYSALSQNTAINADTENPMLTYYMSRAFFCDKIRQNAQILP